MGQHNRQPLQESNVWRCCLAMLPTSGCCVQKSHRPMQGKSAQFNALPSDAEVDKVCKELFRSMCM